DSHDVSLNCRQLGDGMRSGVDPRHSLRHGSLHNFIATRGNVKGEQSQSRTQRGTRTKYSSTHLAVASCHNYRPAVVAFVAKLRAAFADPADVFTLNLVRGG